VTGPDLAAATAGIRSARRAVPPRRSLLVAVSGIDGSGKGWVSARLCAALESRGLRTAVLHADEWLSLPDTRFCLSDPARHFYRHAFRFDEMFEKLVLPLKESRSVRVEADVTEETATAFRRHTYVFDDLDVVLLEGIFLLKRELTGLYDRALWIDCSFETALTRALSRSQEGLPPSETGSAYRTIYFPAQELHFERDAPREAADEVLVNDSRLEPETASVAPASEGG
jgi:uridine kinase